jgi:hypothetical protein
VWVNVPGGKNPKKGLSRLLDTGRIRIHHHHPIDLLPRALTTHFEVGWLDRELVVPLAGHPLLGEDVVPQGPWGTPIVTVAGTKSVGAGPRLPSPFLSRRLKSASRDAYSSSKTEIFSGAHKMLQLLHRLSYRQIPNHGHNNTSPIVS